MRLTTTLAIAIGLGTLAACAESPQEEAAEATAENIMENAENTAENIMANADNAAENVMDTAANEAEAVENTGEATDNATE